MRRYSGGTLPARHDPGTTRHSSGPSHPLPDPSNMTQVIFKQGPYDGQCQHTEFAGSVIYLPWPIDTEESEALMIDTTMSWRHPEAVYNKIGRSNKTGVHIYIFDRRVNYKPE